ncbi:MAG: hypothetical protein ACTSQE_12240 [Candidatus Heimdallarchaeaceae archaeon]
MSNKEKRDTIGKILQKQYNSGWDMLEQAINKVDLEKMYMTEKEWKFVKFAYHIIETADFYSRSTPEGMKWGSKANIDYKEDTEEIIEKKWRELAKSDLLRYHNEIKEKISTILTKTTNVDFMLKDDFHWFDTILEKYLYLLRHTMYHIGELAKALRNWDCSHIKWT